MRKAVFLTVFLSLQLLSVAQETRTYVGHYLVNFPGPQVYRDPRSGTLLYVETDGRHVAAISPDGKLLWNRDPFKDAHLEPYRTETPQIVYLGPVSKSSHTVGGGPDKFVAITFNSSEFGLLRISTGDFEPRGRD